MEHYAIVDVKGKLKPTGNRLLLRPGANLRTGLDDFAKVFPNPTSLEDDVLRVAATIYACDIACKRGMREDAARDFKITIPVVNLRAFKAGAPRLQNLLWFVSRDNWDLEFVRSDGVTEPARTWEASEGKTLLFSGGLDSLTGAVDLLGKPRGSSKVQLVSHVTANPIVITSQNDLVKYLEKRYRTTLDRLVVRTGGRNFGGLSFPTDEDREETQRTRSFAYLAIAVLAARRRGWNRIVMMAENGQMAIHLAISTARAGPFSTRTAHPQFIRDVEKYFSELLEYPIQIENPYAYQTKAEVIRRLVRTHPDALPLAVSCWRSTRVGTNYKHCGDCVPCLVRRIAIEVNGTQLAEYKRDLLGENIARLPDDDEGKRNVMDLALFAHAFLNTLPAQLESDFSDMINPEVDKEKAIELYKRFAGEARKVWTRYPGAACLL
jgi:7-cyano-7-deazaguanine synthase in queuosine biosynthesis